VLAIGTDLLAVSVWSAPTYQLHLYQLHDLALQEICLVSDILDQALHQRFTARCVVFADAKDIKNTEIEPTPEMHDLFVSNLDQPCPIVQISSMMFASLDETEFLVAGTRDGRVLLA
jgi:hypothetical protein